MKYIAIESEYGSGGNEIAREVARKCNIPCFGKEVIESASETYGISTDEFEKYKETISGSYLYTVSILERARCENHNTLIKEGNLYLALQKTIKDFAKEGSAVFIGNCASAVLKNNGNVLRVFIRSTAEEKTKRIISSYNVPEEFANKKMLNEDRKSSAYYFANTTRNWACPDNYDIILDSGKLGISGCVDILEFMMTN